MLRRGLRLSREFPFLNISGSYFREIWREKRAEKGVWRME